MSLTQLCLMKLCLTKLRLTKLCLMKKCLMKKCLTMQFSCSSWRPVTGLCVALLSAGLLAAEPSRSAAPSKPRETVELVEGTNLAAALSPDGERLALALQGVIWTLPAAGGVAQALTAPEMDAHEPVWSPAGDRIAFYAFAKDGFAIWSMAPDGSELVQHTSSDYDSRYPSYSPDGTRLYYATDQEGGYSLRSLDLDSGRAVALTRAVDTGYERPDTPYFRGAGNAVYPVVSPDGTRLAFVIDGLKDTLVVQDLAAGSERTALYEFDLLGAPAWSPDSAALYLVGIEAGHSHLARVSVDGAAVSRLVDAGDVFPFRPDPRADGSVLYTADGAVQVLAAAGAGEPQQIPFSATVSLHRKPYERRRYDLASTEPQLALGIIDPVLSPDGSQLVFAAVGDLWIAEVAGGPARQLTDDPHIDLSPSWSPDGKQIAWISDREGTADLWLLELASGQTTQLTDFEEPSNMPVWSPDGREIAFLRDALTSIFLGARVNVLTVDSKALRVISPPMFGPSAPAWSPDSKRIAVYHRAPSNSRFREGLNVLRLLDSTGAADSLFVSPVPGRSLGRRQFNRPAWSADGNLVYRIDGELWLAPLTSDGQFGASRLIAETGENPSWSASGQQLVYLLGGVPQLFDLGSATTRALSAQPRWQRSHPDGSVTVRAARYFDGDRLAPVGDYAIRMEQGAITAIGLWDSVPDSFRDLDRGAVIDARQQFVMPGLIESHTHQSISQGKALGELFLCHGITTVRETGDDPYHAVERREAEASGRRPSPRVFTAGPLNEGARISYGVSDTIGTLAAAEKSARLSAAMQLDMYKSYVRQDYSVQKRVIELAHAQGIPLSSHELYPAVANGMDYMEHLGATSRRGFSLKQSRLGHAYQDVISLINRSGVVLVPTVAMTERPGRDMEPAFSTLRRVAEGGGRFVAGTDSPFIAHGEALQRELELYAQAGIDPERVLRSATGDAARAIGVGDGLGRIAPGYRADLLILDQNPLQDMTAIRTVSRVIKNGAPVNCGPPAAG